MNNNMREQKVTDESLFIIIEGSNNRIRDEIREEQQRIIEGRDLLPKIGELSDD